MNMRAGVGLLSAIALVVCGAWLLRASAAPPSITVRWESGSEEDVAGFNLWRADPDSPLGLINHKLTEQLIPAEGSPLQGAAYAFVDEDVVPGATYTYQIEEVSPAGLGRRHPDTIEAIAADNRWPRIQGGLALLVGLSLAWMHVRDERRSRRSADLGSGSGSGEST